MDSLVAQLNNAVTLIQFYLPSLLWILAVIWAVNFVNWAIGSPLFVLGIFPRKWWSLPGILFAPWLHKNFNHLFYNSIPLVLLACGALITGWTNFIYITAIIIVLSGLLTWLAGRPGVHIGASGLIMGYWSYLLALAYWLDTGVAVFVGFIALYYFGSLATNLLPSEAEVSWEGHIYGFLSGFAAAYWQFA